MTSAPPRRVGLRDVFAQGGYRRLWSARTASQWGDVFATVALSLLVFDLTGSPLGQREPRTPHDGEWCAALISETVRIEGRSHRR